MRQRSGIHDDIRDPSVDSGIATLHKAKIHQNNRRIYDCNNLHAGVVTLHVLAFFIRPDRITAHLEPSRRASEARATECTSPTRPVEYLHHCGTRDLVKVNSG